jgi:large subunit ribosomal protein L21
MFAVVRTGGKQYRVAPGDKIVVEKLAGEAGERVDLTDVLFAGEGSDLKSTSGLIVAAEIIAQAKGDKVTVFKKRRRHNYRRKKGHRQQHTILRIVAIGDHKAEQKPAAKPAASKAEGADKPAKAAPAPKASAATDSTAKPDVKAPVTENPAPDSEAQANPPKAKTAAPAKAAAKPAAKPAAKASTKNAAPAKGAAKKPTKTK